MRPTYRVVILLLILLGGATWGVEPLIGALLERWFRADVELRSELVFDSIHNSVTELVAAKASREIDDLFQRIAQDEQLLALGLCAPDGRLIQHSASWPAMVTCPQTTLRSRTFNIVQIGDQRTLMAAFALTADRPPIGQLVILHDLRFIKQRSDRVELYLAILLALFGLGAIGATVVVTRLTLHGWVRAIRRGMADQTAGRSGLAPDVAPLVREMRKMLRELDLSQTVNDAIRVDWGPDSLRNVLHNELPGAEVIVVSNREPYIHTMENEAITLQRPASGLVTALEPIMRACGGTWIAHGGGSGDRQMVDADDHVAVPPDAPAYTLRRVWLSAEQYEGYYLGLANEGLWPLCHITFVRPVFRQSDWEHYQAVNRKFAEAVIAEARTPNPVVLIQDYHFALLPKMVHERLPEATIITFWHIPWPNPEVFSICPWKEEILSGLLGSSILGFHTQFHCLNFRDSVDRFLECHIDREHSTIRTGDCTTLIRPYPISIEWPPAALAGLPDAKTCRANVGREYGIDAEIRLAVGVERFDYTKGITDRFKAVESLLEIHPEWIGRFTLLQIAAPTRSRLAAYRDTQVEAEQTAAAINTRLGRNGWNPIVLVAEHHEPDRVFTLFRAADLCLVSSLHDGMNLVAKEFVAARDDEDGVLVLSSFTGASRELMEALIVNPYDIRAMGEALHTALSMPAEQRRERMRLMREVVGENTIFFWAGRMLLDAARMRKRRNIEHKITAVSHEPPGETRSG